MQASDANMPPFVSGAARPGVGVFVSRATTSNGLLIDTLLLKVEKLGVIQFVFNLNSGSCETSLVPISSPIVFLHRCWLALKVK